MLSCASECALMEVAGGRGRRGSEKETRSRGRDECIEREKRGGGESVSGMLVRQRRDE